MHRQFKIGFPSLFSTQGQRRGNLIFYFIKYLHTNYYNGLDSKSIVCDQLGGPYGHIVCLCYCIGGILGQTENLRDFVGRNIRIVRRAVCQPFRIYRRTEHTAFYQRIRIDTFCILHRFTSRPGILFLFQKRRHATQSACSGSRLVEPYRRVCHLRYIARPSIDARTGRYPIGCRNQYTGSRCRPTNAFAVAIRW